MSINQFQSFLRVLALVTVFIGGCSQGDDEGTVLEQDAAEGPRSVALATETGARVVPTFTPISVALPTSTFSPTAVATATAMPSPTVAVTPTATSFPTVLPEPTQIQEPLIEVPTATVLKAGPGDEYDNIGHTKFDNAKLEAISQSRDGQWLELSNGCWIDAQAVTEAPPELSITRWQPEAQQILPDAQTAGTFTNLEANEEGRYTLQLKGPTVNATVATTRSPAQYFAREKLEPLFTIPEGFRPAIEITQAVEAWQVQKDGSPDPRHADPLNLALRVSTDGTVRYVDSSQLDGVGYVSYAAPLAWPVAGAAPEVCARSASVQNALLAQISELGDSPDSCESVTWTQLATVRSLETLVTIQNAWDLAGLNGLEELELTLQANWPAALLAPTPHLQTLYVRGGYLHGDYLRYVYCAPKFPSDFLAYTPQLTTLQLKTYTLDNLPQDFLKYTPRLTKLALWFWYPWDRLLPKDFLVHTPDLTDLFLLLPPRQETLTADLLDPVAGLKTLKINSPHLTTFPLGFLASVPQLQTLALDLYDDVMVGSRFTHWPDDMFEYTPLLAQLSVDVPAQFHSSYVTYCEEHSGPAPPFCTYPFAGRG